MQEAREHYPSSTTVACHVCSTPPMPYWQDYISSHVDLWLNVLSTHRPMNDIRDLFVKINLPLLRPIIAHMLQTKFPNKIAYICWMQLVGRTSGKRDWQDVAYKLRVVCKHLQSCVLFHAEPIA